MPTYEYHCEANGRTVEVMHPMSHTVKTWGEICTLNEADPGPTPADTPVERVVTAGMVRSSKPQSVSVPFSGCGCGNPQGPCGHSH